MREIKYRVWNEELKEEYTISKEKYLGSTGIVDPYVGHEKAVWMQSTGLTDVKGTFIKVECIESIDVFPYLHSYEQEGE